MKCKCKNTIPEGRLRLGFKVCVNCSSVEAYGCAPLINHKTGNSIQIMSSEDARKIAKLTRRKGYGTMLGTVAILISLSSCSIDKQVLSAHGQENDYYYETEAIHENLTEKEYTELIACENCDEID